MKKLFIISSVLFGVFLLFFLIYNFLFKNNPLSGKVPNMTVVKNDTAKEEARKEDLSALAIAPLTDEEGTALFFDASDHALFYLAPSERLLKEIFMATGSPKTVTSLPFEPRDILWAPQGRQALIKKSDTEWALFTRETKEVKLLKSGIESPAWTSLGDAIVYKYYDADSKTRTINIANPDGSDWKQIRETKHQFLEMRALPKSSSMAIWNRGNAFEQTDLRMLPVVGGDARSVFASNFGADYLFAPNGKTILVSSLVEKGGTGISLATINAQGGGYRNLFIPSFAGKAVWSKDSRVLYYALPGSVPAGSILPNDYYRKPILTSDTFWKVDTEKGESSRIVDTNDIDRSYDAESMVLDTDETMLFFRNRHDGRIYRIHL